MEDHKSQWDQYFVTTIKPFTWRDIIPLTCVIYNFVKTQRLTPVTIM